LIAGLASAQTSKDARALRVLSVSLRDRN